MLFRLVRPMRRKGSRNHHFVQRLPADVKAKAVGLKLAIPLGDEAVLVAITQRTRMVRFSLRTDDAAEVKARQAAAAIYLQNVWDGLRNDAPVVLTHMQAVALSGELYRGWASGERERTTGMEHDPETREWRPIVEARLSVEEWDGVLAHWQAVKRAEDLEKPFGPILDRLLLDRHGIHRVTPESRSMVLSELLRAIRDAFENRKRNAEGDYRPDSKAGRFPEWKSVRASVTVSCTGLVEAWWKEAQAIGRKPSTHESHRNTMATFVAFLKHGDAGRVTRDDVLNFKDHRLASINPRTGRRISPKTVKDSDLAGLKTVFAWAVANGKIATNPAEGVTIKLGKSRRLRSKGFTDAEAIAILTAAAKVKQAGERPQTFAAKRWVPWLLAYTGARVGELAQLRKEDVRHEEEHWIVRITPEAGTVKTDEARVVVLHPHLVELGFTKFVEAARSGHLFVTPSKTGDVLGPLQGVKNRIAEFVRTVVADENVAPNHGWRHRFKTVGIEAGIEHRVLDAIQGQSSRNVAEGYGEVTIRAQAKAITRMPRYRIK